MPEMTRTPQHGDIVMFKENDGFEVFGRTILFAGRLYADGRPVPETGVTILAAVPDEDDAPLCSQCGNQAVCEMRPTNIPAKFEPFCRSCADNHHSACEEIFNHEMKHFGGSYGLPGIEERTLSAAPQPPTTNGGKS
jgi:hypothetical protein